jgi:peptidoglycan/xylan/chitin deacetylase (PgdA/CDA1 family)
MLFADISNHKLAILMFVMVLLFGMTILSVMTNSVWNVLPSLRYAFARGSADMWYTVMYKIPSGVFVYANNIPPDTSDYARSIPILVYHGEGDTSDMPISVFLDHMRSLKRDGWRTITLDEFEAFMKNGAKLPDKSFLLTFDDGRRDTFYAADPIMKDLGFHAIMFTITGLSLPDNGTVNRFYLTKTELAYMADSGRWELESHGKLDHLNYAVESTTDSSKQAETVNGHFLSNKFWNIEANRFETDSEYTLRVKNDLILSKQTLEDVFNTKVIAFAYPFNDFGQSTVNFPGSREILDAIVPTVYTFAFYQHWPGNGDTFNYPDPNTYRVGRIEPEASWSGENLISELDAGRAKDLPFESSSFGLDWIGSWGKIEKGDELTIAASEDTSGGSAFLNGSKLWKNYTFTATIDWLRGSDVSLIARNTQDVNYFACAFSDNNVTIEIHRNGVQTNIATVPHRLQGSKDNMTLGIQVNGPQIACYENGARVASTYANDFPQGGVGIQVWNKAFGVALVHVKNVSIQPL